MWNSNADNGACGVESGEVLEEGGLGGDEEDLSGGQGCSSSGVLDDGECDVTSIPSALVISFKVLQVLTRLLTSDLEKLNCSLDFRGDSPVKADSVRRCVARMTTVYRNSQIRLTAAALEVLGKRYQRLISTLGVKAQQRIATGSDPETLCSLATNATAAENKKRRTRN